MSMAEIRLFGRFDIRCDGASLTEALAQKARELLAYLLLHRAVPQHRGHLAAVLWQETSDVQAKSYLRKALWQLQSVLPIRDQLLLVEPEWIHFADVSHARLDIMQFEQTYSLVLGVPSAELGDWQVHALHQATTLYRGELLVGWHQEWCLLERERFTCMNLIMLDKLVEHCLAHDRVEQGIAYANRLLSCDEVRERTHRHLMRLFLMAGDRTSAIRQFRRCAQILQDELSIEPGPETVVLYQAICRNIACVGGEEAEVASMPTMARHEHLLQVAQLLRSLRSAVDGLQQQVDQELGQRHGPSF